MNTSGNSSSLLRDLSQGSSKKGPSKPRGRPRGSKNRPKQEPKRENMAIKPVTLEVPAGVDIINWVANFAKSNQVCITVTAGFGVVSLAVFANVLSQTPHREYKEYLAVDNFSGTYVFSPLAQTTQSFFNAALSRVNGQLIGGEAFRMVTMGKVVLSAYVFRNSHVFATEAAEFH
ncbi:AT-hook motif nuclear-localized protein 28 [Daucus carota subsp. sativus]|uniref:PPC domain-containing protein n=1 Tax=Daucus carota subsp. sativus TaxID=79200 RepID=A0A166DQA0_DAUCS|nr:PREDICTED: AT-hook motif nuclear-localized protein 28-like [Daucus carota subsp. sativus]